MRVHCAVYCVHANPRNNQAPPTTLEPGSQDFAPGIFLNFAL